MIFLANLTRSWQQYIKFSLRIHFQASLSPVFCRKDSRKLGEEEEPLCEDEAWRSQSSSCLLQLGFPYITRQYFKLFQNKSKYSFY